jgi:hypothetical protein
VIVDRQQLLPVLAGISGLAWMVAVLLVAANPKGIDLAGDLAYDRANRVHTLALVLLMATAIVVYRALRKSDLAGQRAAKVLMAGAGLMLLGNTMAFWGALVVGQQSDQFWGGWAGWLTYLPGDLLVLGSFIALARAARQWPNVTRTQRWTIGFVGPLLSATTLAWAISPAVTLVFALPATFALLTAGTAVAHATRSGVDAVGPDGQEHDAEPVG